jgi:serine/threonine protein kinase
MDRSAAATSEATELREGHGESANFRDGLGERQRHQGEGGSAEWLCLPPELASAPSFEFALRERVSRLASFRHPAFGMVRGVERAAKGLVLVSDHTPGVRLSALLDQSHARALPIDLNAALCLIRQLVPAIASLHETVRDAAHGALAPERLVLTPQGRLVVVEYTLGSALEQLLLSREKYWTDLRVALPRVAGLPRFDHVTDVTQLGIVALALMLGRNLQRDEYPSRVSDVIRNASAVSTRGSEGPLPGPIRSWLERMVQVDSRQSFPSAVEARASLEQAIAESGYDASPVSLEMFTARLHGADRPAPSVSNAAPGSARGQAAAFTPPPMKIPYGVASAPTPPPMEVPTLAAAHTPPPMRVPPPVPTPSPMTVPAAAAHIEMPSPPAIEKPWLLSSPGVSSASITSESEDADVETAVSGRAPSFGVAPGHDVPAHAPRRWWIPAAGAGAALVIGLAIGAPRLMTKPAPPAPTTGTLVVTTDPPGARVIVDGKARGAAPLTLNLDAGSHKLELRGAGASRTIPLTIVAGQQVSQYVDLPKPVAEHGSLRVRSQPDGAEVVIDNTPRGKAPIVVQNLAPGEHVVTVKADNGTATQTVTIEAGVAASVVVPIVQVETAPVSGWLTLATPFPVQIFENGQLIGSSDSDRVMVAAGRHELELRSERLGYQASRSVQVAAGKVSTVRVEAPKGSIAINAQPWAEVWIDGEKVGETPIGNHELTIGAHEVMFRHPDFGERKQTAVVTQAAPTRLIVDMRKP